MFWGCRGQGKTVEKGKSIKVNVERARDSVAPRSRTEADAISELKHRRSHSARE